jgi:hypothetical protein
MSYGCDHVMRSGGFCGRPMGHGGKHYRPETVRREAERMRLRRTTPGPCTVKGCTNDRRQFYTGNYDVRCLRHKDLNDSEQAVRLADLEFYNCLHHEMPRSISARWWPQRSRRQCHERLAQRLVSLPCPVLRRPGPARQHRRLTTQQKEYPMTEIDFDAIELYVNGVRFTERKKWPNQFAGTSDEMPEEWDAIIFDPIHYPGGVGIVLPDNAPDAVLVAAALHLDQADDSAERGKPLVSWLDAYSEGHPRPRVLAGDEDGSYVLVLTQELFGTAQFRRDPEGARWLTLDTFIAISEFYLGERLFLGEPGFAILTLAFDVSGALTMRNYSATTRDFRNKFRPEP